MKLTNLFYGLVLSAVFAVAFSSCGDDITLPDNNPPQITLVDSGTDVISSDATVDADANVSVDVKATVGTGDLKLLTILENGEKLDLERITGGLNSNPAFFTAGSDDAKGFQKKISFKTQSEGVSDYMFLVEDVNGLKDSVVITLTAVQKTELNFFVDSIVVFNFSGPYKGSIDLQTGIAVSSSNEDGDVQDVGITSNGDWLKKIKPKNGAEMVVPASDFDFDAVADLEGLLADYALGIVASEADVTVGSSFLFKTPSATSGQFDYFVLKTLDMHETTGDNKDYYVFTLKGYKF